MTPDAAWNTARAYYPGNEFVDILGGGWIQLGHIADD